MSDLIEKKEVLNAIRACAMSEEISPKIIYQTVNQMTPAQEIIWCKDCYYHPACPHEQYLGLDGFCSHAERREESNE